MSFGACHLLFVWYVFSTAPVCPGDTGTVHLIIDEIQDSLRFYKKWGCRGFDCSGDALAKINRWGQRTAYHNETLESILNDVTNCRCCRIFQSRRNVVFGEGNPRARLMFVGGAPGPEEDGQGKPFAGPAGQLLTKIIEAMHLARSQVYLCNILKCRPPGDQAPLPGEIKACYPFLKRQISVIRPEFICALGTVAAQTLLKTKQPVSGLRGRFHDFHGARLMPTYHPDYLLRNGAKKRDVWEDMKKLMQAMKKQRKNRL